MSSRVGSLTCGIPLLQWFEASQWEAVPVCGSRLEAKRRPSSLPGQLLAARR